MAIESPIMSQDERITRAEQKLEEAGIFPGTKVRNEQHEKETGEDGWTYHEIVMQGEDAVARITKGNEEKNIPVGRLIAWQKDARSSSRGAQENIKRDLHEGR